MKLYEIQENVFVNKKIFDDLTKIHDNKIRNEHDGECFPNYNECNQCWTYKCDNCRNGFNDMRGNCNNTSCFEFMRKKLYLTEVCMDKKNSREILITRKSLYLENDEQLQYETDKIGNKSNWKIVFIRNL
jgi:hypothetical protein